MNAMWCGARRKPLLTCVGARTASQRWCRPISPPATQGTNHSESPKTSTLPLVGGHRNAHKAVETKDDDGTANGRAKQGHCLPRTAQWSVRTHGTPWGLATGGSGRRTLVEFGGTTRIGSASAMSPRTAGNRRGQRELPGFSSPQESVDRFGGDVHPPANVHRAQPPPLAIAPRSDRGDARKAAPTMEREQHCGRRQGSGLMHHGGWEDHILWLRTVVARQIHVGRLARTRQRLV